jgi:hypothetical protein
MQAPIKVCPQCGQSTDLNSPRCPNCGHAYRTPFNAPDGPTQAYQPSPPPRSSFGPTMNAPPPLPPNTQVCTNCHNPIVPPAAFCRFCGADQRTLGHYMPPAPAPAYPPPVVYAPPPSYAPVPMYAPAPQYAPPPAMYSPHLPYVRPPDDFEMFDLARQYQSSKKTFIWSLVIGLLLFWPLLILAYSEHTKMRGIKSRVALRGVDPETWSRYL